MMELLKFQGFQLGRKGSSSTPKELIESSLYDEMTRALLDTGNDTVRLDRFPTLADSAESITAANQVLGEAHARHLAKTTPVVPIKDLKAHDVVVEMRKVNKFETEDGLPQIALYIDGHKWTFQPEPGKPKSLLTYLQAHDIHRHLLLRRDRTMNLTTPTAEYLTGQVNNFSLNPPRVPQMWDGMIANYADAKLPQPAFRLLMNAVNVFREDPDIPVGSSLRIKYHLPPPDIMYRDTDRKLNVHMGFSAGTRGNLAQKKIYSAVKAQALYDALCRNPEAQRKTTGNVTKIRIVHPEKDLITCWEFKRDKPNGPITGAVETWLSSEGKKLNLEKAQHRQQGVLPKVVINENEFYVWDDPQTGHARIEKIYDTLIEWREVNPKPLAELEAVYTGQPYQPVTIAGIEALGPNNRPLDDARISPHLSRLLTGYQEAFKTYQANIQELLESGHIPPDEVPLDPNGSLDSSLLDFYQADTRLPQAGPMTSDAMLSGMIQRDLPFPAELFKDEDGLEENITVRHFPPPPYGGKHFQKPQQEDEPLQGLRRLWKRRDSGSD